MSHSGGKEHSRYKRLILGNILSGIFPYYWHSQRAKFIGEYMAPINYLDGFAGQGKYNENVKTTDDVSYYGSPIVAIEKALMALEHCCGNFKTEERFSEIFDEYDYVVHFFFNDNSRENIDQLKILVKERFELHEWKLTKKRNGEGLEEEDVTYEGSVELSKLQTSKNLRMRVTFFISPFEKLPLENLPSPLFSFVDPYGISQIPMTAMKQIVGEDRDVFVNFMAQVVDRSRSAKKAVQNVYGQSFRREIYDSVVQQKDPEQRRKDFAEWYADSLDEEFKENEENEMYQFFWPDGYYRVLFSFSNREDLKNKKKSTLYYMVYGSCKLNFIHEAKYAMMNVTDLPDDLSFSYYNRKDGREVQYERKTDDSFEADEIWKATKGRMEMFFGDLKKEILLETPFVYHSRALKVLEDTLQILHVDTDGEKRRRGVFPYKVEMFTYNEPLWKISFSNDTLFDKTQKFLNYLKEGQQDAYIDLFSDWLFEKMKLLEKDERINDGEMTRDVIHKMLPKKCFLRTPSTPDIKIPIGKKTMDKALENLLHEGKIRKTTDEPINKTAFKLTGYVDRKDNLPISEATLVMPIESETSEIKFDISIKQELRETHGFTDTNHNSV